LDNLIANPTINQIANPNVSCSSCLLFQDSKYELRPCFSWLSVPQFNYILTGDGEHTCGTISHKAMTVSASKCLAQELVLKNSHGKSRHLPMIFHMFSLIMGIAGLLTLFASEL
jgi:hypothetical protein